jgi:hypothetical protein
MEFTLALLGVDCAAYVGSMVWYRARQRRIDCFVATAGLLAALGGGAWWTAQAVAAGQPWTMVVRFALSVVVGVYYLALLTLSRRPS